MSTAHIALTVIGGASDITGACLVAAADLVPRFRKARSSAVRHTTTVRARALAMSRRFLGWPPPRTHTVSAGAALGFEVGGAASLISGVDPAADVDRKLSFLLDQARRNQ